MWKNEWGKSPINEDKGVMSVSWSQSKERILKTAKSKEQGAKIE
jgi:hypothetical protein